MARVTSKEIEGISAPCFKRIDDNLYLKAAFVKNNLYKTYYLRYQLNGKRIDKSLGSINKLTLKQAKDKCRKLLVDLSDKQIAPAETLAMQKQNLKLSQERAIAVEQVPTFKEFSRYYLNEIKAKEWKRPHKEVGTWNNRLTSYAYPFIGNKKLNDIKRRDIVELLTPIWLTKNESAVKLRRYISQIMNYYIDLHDLEWSDPAPQRITALLPKYTGSVEHFASLHYEKAPAFFKRLQGNIYTGGIALKMIMLTGSRQNEVRQARWSQIDFENDCWLSRIFKRERRLEREFILPIPIQPILKKELLQLKDFAHNEEQSDYIFHTGEGGGQFITEAAIRKQLDRYGERDYRDKPITMHGFRTTFMDWARANQKNEALADIQLSHVHGSKVDQAYKRDNLFELRKELMFDYADYLQAA